jgi:hypothetical protein
VIVFVVTPEHPYTVQDIVEQSPGPKVKVTTYDELFGLSQVPLATYIFTDLDRLPLWRVHQAAIIYRQLRQAGARVLNDPARAPSRFGLLRQLYRCGINSFNAYRVEEGLIPKSWPVFLRCEGGHDAPLTDLMHDWDEARRAVDTAIADGAPLTSLLLVEYAAEPVAPGLFRKLSMYRLGDTYVAGHCVHEGNWLVKYGTKGIATPELYEDELRLIRDNPFEAALKPAFELAGIEYGRADFGLVGGKVEIYEINTNPHVKFPTEPSPFRVESHALFRDKFYEALGRLDFRVLSDQTS